MLCVGFHPPPPPPLQLVPVTRIENNFACGTGGGPTEEKRRQKRREKTEENRREGKTEEKTEEKGR